MPDQIVTQAELRAVLAREYGAERRLKQIRTRFRKGATVEPGELRIIVDPIARSFTVTSRPITPEVANA